MLSIGPAIAQSANRQDAALQITSVLQFLHCIESHGIGKIRPF